MPDMAFVRARPGRMESERRHGRSMGIETESGRQEVGSEGHACLADGIGHESSSASDTEPGSRSREVSP